MSSIPQDPPACKLISKDEAATILHLSSSRVNQLIKDGRLPGQIVGRAWRLPEAAVIEFARTYHPVGRRAPIADRFWPQVQKTDGCWLWQGYTNNHDYGQIYLNGQFQLAHRVAWQLLRGPIPDGLCILHECDTPRCVNPDHLRPGTMAENTADMVARRRCHFTVTPEQEEQIRQRWATGQVTKVGIAKEMNIGRMVVRRVLEGPRSRRTR